MGAGVFNGFFLNAEIFFLQFWGKFTWDVARRTPRGMNPFIKNLELGGYPALTGFGFGDKIEKPGISNHLGNVGHAALFIVINANISFGMVHLDFFGNEKWRGVRPLGLAREASIQHGQFFWQAFNMIDHHEISGTKNARNILIRPRVEAHAVGRDAIARGVFYRFFRVMP